MIKVDDIEQNLKQIILENHTLSSINVNDNGTVMPRIAKDRSITKQIDEAIKGISTSHLLSVNDAREMHNIPSNSIHLILTSPPYWSLKKYNDSEGQLGHIQEYDQFLDELDKVWRHSLRVLVPGGRLIIVVGDVCLSRRKNNYHTVIPLHSSIQERCRLLGFCNLAPIIWSKISNVNFEVNRGGGFLGKPYEPNAVIKNEIEYILMMRKSEGYRNPSKAARLLSVISEINHKRWFKQIWNIPGESTKYHPAPFPLKLAERLVRMYSFVGDVVFDPFMGTGTTNIAAKLWGRNSIGFEIDTNYFKLAKEKLGVEQYPLFERGQEDNIQFIPESINSILEKDWDKPEEYNAWLDL